MADQFQNVISGSAVGSKFKQHPITNISEWLQAFAVYVSVIARKQLQHVPDLMGYQILMLEASNEYQGNCWLAYDRRSGNKLSPNQTANGPILIT